VVFPIQKCGFLSKVKEIKRLCGDVAGYVAQTNSPIDAEIGQKDHLWMETNQPRQNDCVILIHHNSTKWKVRHIISLPLPSLIEINFNFKSKKVLYICINPRLKS